MNTNDDFSRYFVALDNNRNGFLLNHSDKVVAFARIFENFTCLCNIVRTGRDSNNRTHVSLLWFLQVMQRQTIVAFNSLRSYQSFAAWELLRPCLESALFIGKWVDNKVNADIWSNQSNDLKAYLKAYQGKELVSSSISASADIQAVC